MNEKDKRLEIKGHLVEYFDDTHTYFIDGNETLSATQISQLLNPFKIMKIPNHVLKMAGDRGTKIHEAIEHYLKTGEHFDENDKHYGYFEAFLKLEEELKSKGWKVHTLEHIAISTKYDTPLVGTIDCYCEIDGRKAIIDWKTSSMLTLPEWRTQLSNYRELVRYTHGAEEVDLYVGWLKKDGTAQLLKIEPLKDEYIDLLFNLLEHRDIISRFNILKYEIYGEELIK